MYNTYLFTYITEFFSELLGLYTIQDYIEVIFFVTVVHQTSMWLKQDHTKHLLLGAYSYCALAAFSYATSCTILLSTLVCLLPAGIIFWIVIHQKQLQKNFVLPSKKYFTPTTTPQKNWLDSLIQSCLIASHRKKNITCIIEYNNTLTSLLHSPYMLHLPIQQEITNLILSSEHVTNQSVLWANQSGIIQSVNVTWNTFLKNEILVKTEDDLSLQHEAALLITQKTDALIFSINTTTDAHTIWYQGKCLHQISVKQLLLFIKNKSYQQPSSHNALKKGTRHDQKHSTPS